MTPDPSPPPGDLPPASPPEPVRRISDLETLRAISDPTRVRILETMVTRHDSAWSVKELAAALGVPQTRLYHHVELLAERDLIRAAERRVVSGIIETRYQVAALSFQLDRRLLSGASEEGRTALHEALLAVFDTARAEIELAITLGLAEAPAGTADANDAEPADEAPGPDPTPGPSRIILSRGMARLTLARAAELADRLRALEAEFGNDPDGEAHGLVLALYPMPPAQEPRA